MAQLDIFQGDAFNMASLTEAVNKMPFQPMRLKQMGIFSDRPIRTTVAHVEEKHGTLRVLSTAGRGSVGNVRSRPQREVRNFRVPHVPNWGAVSADDVQNIRAFGSETELEAVSQVVADELQNMRMDHEVTQEYHRVGATQGVILDSDGSSVIYDLFAEWGISRTSVAFDFTDGAVNMKTQAAAVIREMSTALGMTSFTGIVGICGDAFFDALVAHASVAKAYERWNSSEFFRVQQLGPDFLASANGFMFGDIYWFNYRGKVGSLDFYPTNDCSFVPLGVPGLFNEVLAPGDMMDTVNTRGQRFYAKQELKDFNKGVELHTQSNTLALCNRPAALILGDGTVA